MSKDRFGITHSARLWIAALPLAALILIGLAVTAHIARADAPPAPNPLKPIEAGGNPIFAPVPGVDITQNGPAASMHGDPYKGRLLFAQNCTTCHGDRGTNGITNPGSDDGSVPTLNPIDPGFIENAGNVSDIAAAFAQEIDLFIQHGSRPAGDNPQYSMIGWGDHKLLTQEQIANVEAYVMQMNGVYWGDRYYPPAEVRMSAVRSNDTITYTINIVSDSSTPLTDWTLRDTLPNGLALVKSGMGSVDSGDPGQVVGSTVEWSDQAIPGGGIFGPFIIVTRLQDASKPAPTNVAQLLFNFTTFDNAEHSTSAVSDPIAPAAPTPIPTATPTATPSPTASASTTAAPTPTPAPTAANVSAKIVQRDVGALSWGFDPQTITVHVGDKVTWTNTGSLGHTVTADDGSFDSGVLNTNDTWSFTFNTAGTFSFHCTPHPWMKGTITVQP